MYLQEVHITKSSWERLAAKRRNCNSRGRNGLCGYVSGLLGYFHVITKHPSSVAMIPWFFYHAVLRVSFLLLALKSNWSPSHIDLILTASWHSEGSPVCAPGCGSRRSFITPQPLLTASQLIATCPASVHANPSYTLWQDSCSRSTAFITHSCCFRSFSGTLLPNPSGDRAG